MAVFDVVSWAIATGPSGDFILSPVIHPDGLKVENPSLSPKSHDKIQYRHRDIDELWILTVIRHAAEPRDFRCLKGGGGTKK